MQQQQYRSSSRDSSNGRGQTSINGQVVRAPEEGTMSGRGRVAMVAHGLRRVCFKAIEEPHGAFMLGAGGNV